MRLCAIFTKKDLLREVAKQANHLIDYEDTILLPGFWFDRRTVLGSWHPFLCIVIDFCNLISC